MSDSERPRRDQLGHIAQWLAIAVILAGIVSRFVSLEEEKQKRIDVDAEQKQRLDKQDDRIRGLENSRTVEERLGALTTEVVALKVKIDVLNDELHSRRR